MWLDVLGNFVERGGGGGIDELGDVTERAFLEARAGRLSKGEALCDIVLHIKRVNRGLRRRVTGFKDSSTR